MNAAPRQPPSIRSRPWQGFDSLALEMRHLDPVKRLLGQSAPHIKSSHRTEAMARGLGFASHAALLAALAAERTVEVSPSVEAFEAFLGERGYAVQGLQRALLPEATRLACGVPWRAEHVAGTRMRHCLHCLDPFASHGSNNRLCEESKLRENRVAGVEARDNILESFLMQVLRQGAELSGLDHLRSRPGWTDLLDAPVMEAEIARQRTLRDHVRNRRWHLLGETESNMRDMVGHDAYLRDFSWDRE